MKNFNNVRGVHFNIHFKGNGCVNYDGKDSQKSLYYTYKWFKGEMKNNFLYAKKTFKMFKDENGDETMKFKYKVSSEALRHAIFEKEIPFQNPNISNIPYIFYNAIAMPEYIVRGYMFTESGGLALKKKSVLTITDAIEDSNIWRDSSSFEFHSRTGGKKISDKNTAVDDDNSADPKDTTIYSIENVGKLDYVAEGFIDLTELQFISADPTYDRQGVNVDGGANEEIYLSALKNNFPTLTEPKINYYYMENTYTKDEWAERGIMLDTESVSEMVKNTLKKITNILISRRGSFFQFDSMTIDVICDGGDESKVSPITITKESDIDDLNFVYYQKYFLANDEKIIQRRKEMDALVEEKKIKAKEEKKNKANKNKKVAVVEQISTDETVVMDGTMLIED